ncbi:unnamed protein product [Mycena citricolor]|uniref:tripeptidyl-peptidase II n=1 Tax=Mycena citricolor TaxID=2018698 RepID=A0AAD2HSK1_9AGAR|nr:unnamed protein product [Mycena citricolor]CAK5281055.1 unnamed protein product [Mycena citricolor]
MSFSSALTVLAAIAAVAAAKGPMVLHESRTTTPVGFVSHGPAPATDQLELRFALAQNNPAGLQNKLMEVSTPGNDNYRQWLSMEDVKSYMAPSADTVAAFNTFAAAQGLQITGSSPNGDWVTATLPVSQANELFDANFEVFSHPELADTITRTMSVSLPHEIVGVVDVIHPSTAFVEPQPRLAPSVIQLDLPVQAKRAIPASCNTRVASGVMTPACLQALYGIPTAPATQKNNSILITGYIDQWAQTADLQSFLKTLRKDMSSSTSFAVQTVDGGANIQSSADAGIEADLDVEYTIGIATGVPATFLSVGNSVEFPTALIDTTTFLDGVKNPPSVMTTSYGSTETSFGGSLATRICNGYMALSSRGISVVFASGDGGVRGNHDTTDICSNNRFMPVFPAACPFVTSVGSTQGIPEKAVNFTGGGFSSVFPAPTYQTTQVSSFLKTLPSNFRGNFTRSGRGYPDVAVQGWNFEVVIGGQTGLIGGTSASAPTFAAMIALVNDRLVAAGKPVLGFLNPFLYKNPAAFTDITTGHNSGLVCPASSVAFDAATGWDALTGLGTPIFSNLLAAAMAAH